MLFDWLVVGGILEMNPASSVRGPKYVIKKGKTPVLTPEEARLLLDSIDVTELYGLRDRALLAMMVYSFARVSAVVGMNVDDYYQQGKRWWSGCMKKAANTTTCLPITRPKNISTPIFTRVVWQIKKARRCGAA
jgi:site-specific recombinase XerC